MQTTMTNQCKRQVLRALLEYYAVIDGTGMTEGTKATYKDNAAQFARWLVGDFEPGVRRGPQGGNQPEDIEQLMDRLLD